MLLTTSSMADYFRDAITKARSKTNVRITSEAETYIVNLLEEFGRSENAFAGVDAGEEVAMATLLSRAQDAAPQEAVRIYRHMGDSSLYLTGFFTESVERRAASRDYYMQMGGSAYANVATLMRTSAATASALFAELADCFAELVSLLQVVSVSGLESASSENVLELLDRYRKTGRPELLEALERHGIVLKPGVKGDEGLVH